MLSDRQIWSRINKMISNGEEDGLISCNNGRKNGNHEFVIEGRTFSILDVSGETDYFISR